MPEHINSAVIPALKPNISCAHACKGKQLPYIEVIAWCFIKLLSFQSIILIRRYSATVAFVRYYTEYNRTSQLNLSGNSAPFAIWNSSHFALYVLFSCLLSSHDLEACCNSNLFSCFLRVWRARPLFKMAVLQIGKSVA